MARSGRRTWTRFSRRKMRRPMRGWRRGRRSGASDGAEGFEVHPLYKASFALTVWIDQIFEEIARHPESARGGPALDACRDRQRQARRRAERRRRGRDRDDDRLSQAGPEGDQHGDRGGGAAPQGRLLDAGTLRHAESAAFPDPRRDHRADGRVSGGMAAPITRIA